ncbi:hypothetical protein BREV_BREV_02754 [Brevundimonas mediterranea]|jgi:hypothetical protein|uniref:Uncharacterized protein n=1 Tax=Brevundimonas mediterranea TaxID=74329 RepID=A0A7Z8Y5S7_9CAUL|nr:hypothetical protein BREV_BREV_02754 [Brevundimonas mediterranea]
MKPGAVSVLSHMCVIVGHRFIEADAVSLVMNQRMVGLVQFNEWALPIILRNDIAHQCSRLRVARYRVREIAEHDSKLRLVGILEGVPIAVDIGFAERGPGAKLQSLIAADYGQNKNAANVEIHVFKPTEVTLKNPVSRAFLGCRPVIRRGRMESESGKTVVDLPARRTNKRRHFADPTRRQTTARQTYWRNAGLVASRFRPTPSLPSRTA